MFLPRRSFFALLLCVPLWPASATNNFRFAIVGDRTGGPVQGVYAQVWREVEGFRPDFVINVGDTIQGTDDETAEAQWKEIRTFLSKFNRFPFYLVPGNHDVWSGRSLKLFEREAGRPLPYSFDYQNAHFVVLDNSRDALFGDDEMRFLDADLARNRERSPKFIFFHDSFWLLFLKAGNRAFPVHTLAKQYGAGYVVSGHGHQLIRMVEEGVTYLEVGSSGARLGEPRRPDEGFDAGAFYQHVQVQVKGGQATFTVKEADPPYGRGRSLDLSPWDKSRQ